MPQCKKCKKDKLDRQFEVAPHDKTKLLTTCKECRNKRRCELRDKKTKRLKQINNIFEMIIDDVLVKVKKCNQCTLIKKIEEFGKSSQTKHGLSHKCLKCQRLRQRTYKKEDGQKAKIYYHKTKKQLRKKIPKIWRGILNGCIKRMRQKKTDTTYNLLGYSAEELKLHLESLFLPEMTWENYGTEWSVDHIKPISTFAIDTPAKIVNALCNLQPMWRTSRIINGIFYEGNLNKSNKFSDKNQILITQCTLEKNKLIINKQQKKKLQNKINLSDKDKNILNITIGQILENIGITEGDKFDIEFKIRKIYN